MELPPYLVECPSCDTPFEGHWSDDSMDLEQMDSPPVEDQMCPECGKVFEEAYPGWATFGEAG